jgi:hypothetical protein
MLEDSVPCPFCDRSISVDLAGHYRFHRSAAIAFIDLLKRQGKPAELGDLARARIVACDRLLAAIKPDSSG